MAGFIGWLTEVMTLFGIGLMVAAVIVLLVGVAAVVLWGAVKMLAGPFTRMDMEHRGRKAWHR